MGRTRTAMGRTNTGRTTPQPEGAVQAAMQPKANPQRSQTDTQSESSAKILLMRKPGVVDKERESKSPSPKKSPARESGHVHNSPPPFVYDTPRSSSWVDSNAPPTPDFEEPEKIIASNMLALKRCRHKLNVHAGGAKRFFLDWSADKSGNLSREEMFNGFNDLHLGFTRAQADFLVRAFDADNSNSVEYNEFCQTMEMTDDDILRTVTDMSVIKPPFWIKPKGWKFNPHERQVARETQERIQQRMHQTFGGNPRDIRGAFLAMDKERAGFLSREDFVRGFEKIGVVVSDAELDLLLATMDNKDQRHRIPFTMFVKNFESQPAGSFNPFKPTEKMIGTDHVTQEQLNNTGAPEMVKKRWSDKYGRDPRYRVSFPEVYNAKLRAESCPPDFSDRPGLEMVDEWRHLARKTIGKEIMTLKSNKPIPPQDSAQYRMRSTRMSQALPPVETPESGSGRRRDMDGFRGPGAMSPFGQKTKEDLMRERQSRFREKSRAARRDLEKSRAASSLSQSFA